MKWEIRDYEGKYIIVPKSYFIYFWWTIYKNFKTLFAPLPYNLTEYFKTIEEAKKNWKMYL